MGRLGSQRHQRFRVRASTAAAIAAAMWRTTTRSSPSAFSPIDATGKKGVLLNDEGKWQPQGRNGRAYLFTNVVNVTIGVKEDRQLRTGLHTVADICCYQCQEVLGWKYEKAFEESQKYKEGKYILEKVKVMKENW